MIIYYDAAFILSVLLAFVYILLWHKHFDVHITLMYLLVPVSNFGYLLMAHAQTREEALNGLLLTYVGGCYLVLFVVFIVFSLCDIRLNRFLRAAMFALSTAMFAFVLTIGSSEIFYKGVTFERVNGVGVLHKEYGVMHGVFLGVVVLYLLLSVGAIVYSYFKKNQVSRKTIYLLSLPVIGAVFSYFIGRNIFVVDPTPAIYIFALAVYIVIVDRMCLYNVADTAVESLVQTGETGLISFDFRYNYLGSNGAAKAALPALNELKVDGQISDNELMKTVILPRLTAFGADQSQNRFEYETGEKIYSVQVNYLYDGKRKRGYQLYLTDDTQNRRYIRLLNDFNSELQTEVARKTAHIVEMHDNLILSMATMVESRDNSTGGHIRRTSEGVRLLIEEMQSDGAPGLTEEFCRNIVKVAPMHDLGKIAVDDAVLRKPGRFTPEEFEKMKAHAAKGAQIVHGILKDTDDREFARIAENVAHYHHERFDGSGYPEGLKGNDIPQEARIMAVADVYDALVSKRVYKERMSFEQAEEIILSGMGGQFDPALERWFRAAKPKLEAYYSSLDQV